MIAQYLTAVERHVFILVFVHALREKKTLTVSAEFRKKERKKKVIVISVLSCCQCEFIEQLLFCVRVLFILILLS